MIIRCRYPSAKGYTDYGGRGIKVCQRWLEFSNFLDDMGAPPVGMLLERKDNNGNYEPGNCAWVTRVQQMRNKRSNRMLDAFGETKAMSAWAEQFGINYGTLKTRIRNGWNPEKALSLPIDSKYSTRYPAAEFPARAVAELQARKEKA